MLTAYEEAVLGHSFNCITANLQSNLNMVCSIESLISKLQLSSDMEFRWRSSLW